jgi:CubicO group peptidase (beta-lactamase class C family)
MKLLSPLILIALGALSACESDDPKPQTPADSLQHTTPDNPGTGATSSLPYFFPGASGTWEHITPDSLNIDASKLAEVLEFARSKNTYGFVMLYKGRIVVERYWNGWNQSTRSPIASASKSIVALLTGIAQENNFLTIADRTSKFLGEGWSILNKEKESKITIRHHLSMTTGLDETLECSARDCFKFKSDAGNRWAYHNNAYYLLHKVIEASTGTSMNDFTKRYLGDLIGLSNTTWEDFNISLSTRDMARFGLLIASKGKWSTTTVLADSMYIKAMLKSSTDKNPAYGYLWWINGEDDFMIPGDRTKYKGPLISTAPADLVSAMGKGDKKIYIVPSKHLVIVRHGNDTGDNVFGPSSFDTALWAELTPLIAQMKMK